jgi:hypothetical protein
VRLLLHSGVDKGAPTWIAALQMAEEWGCHPEDIMTRPGGLKWAARRAFYKQQVSWVQEQKNKT